ncbi:hypothetical protein L9F63_020938, partial [Diploptera punctata]
MKLELAGVTLDSSTDDLSNVATCERRNVRHQRNDLSMDSGIQGSSCDLAARSSSSEEPMDNDSLNRTYVSYSTPSLDDVTIMAACNGTDKVSCDDNQVNECVKPEHFVVVAIDIGTTYSGYAFCFSRDPDSIIHMMRKWEGGDPGLNNQKTPTTLLLSPNGEFHSFGFAARDYFHDLDIQEAKKWFFFDKFKMALHHNQDLNRSTQLQAANGQSVPALKIFAHALRHLKCHALRELSDQTGSSVAVQDVRWVVTVPAIWKQPAKQFMREAAYQAGLCEPQRPEGLLIALEPEAASICCRKLRLNQLVPERFPENGETKMKRVSNSTLSLPLEHTGNKLVLEESTEGTRYMVVDCGGGTVDITVHELSECHGTLRELHKATGGPWGSMGVDFEFEKLLDEVFEAEFMTQFKLKRPAAYIELMLSFEARKRSASHHRDSTFNIFPPFAFIDYYRKYKGKEIEQAVKKCGRKDISWSTQGMLRLQPSVMMELFRPMLNKITQGLNGKVVQATSLAICGFGYAECHRFDS